MRKSRQDEGKINTPSRELTGCPKSCPILGANREPSHLGTQGKSTAGVFYQCFFCFFVFVFLLFFGGWWWWYFRYSNNCFLNLTTFPSHYHLLQEVLQSLNISGKSTESYNIPWLPSLVLQANRKGLEEHCFSTDLKRNHYSS